MSRLLDHWKIPNTLGAQLPDGAPGETPDCEMPTQDSFHGATIWIHPLLDPPPHYSFVSDRGYGFLPNDVVANVALERYIATKGNSARTTTILKNLYYFMKPLMPRRAQLLVQRANARLRIKTVDFPKWPNDDSIPEFLSLVLGQLMDDANAAETPFIGFWPRGFEWAACFTHDVETSKGLATMHRMARIEEERGIRSTWFFVPERYPLDLSDVLRVSQSGHEIGVHGLKHDGRLFSSRKEFLRRVPRLTRYIRDWGAVGFRSPVLYRNPEWISELDIQYDSSFMDTAILEPQVGGVSTVFPYQLSERVVEIPITTPMDHHAINLLRIDTVRSMLTKFRWIVKQHGLANFLFHPEYNLHENQLTDYCEIVDQVTYTGRGWITSGARIADWWQRRRASELVIQNGQLCVEGPAKEDAAIWLARWNGDNLSVEPSERTSISVSERE